MIKALDILIGVLLFSVAHILTFFQLNGQFLKTDWFRKNEFLVAAAGIILSYFYNGLVELRSWWYELEFVYFGI